MKIKLEELNLAILSRRFFKLYKIIPTKKNPLILIFNIRRLFKFHKKNHPELTVNGFYDSS